MQTHTVRPERPTFSNCAEKWIRMNDKNCKATVNWYKACAELADELNGTKRDNYSTALMENIKTSSDNYLMTSKKPLSTLSTIQRELSGVVEGLLFPPHLTEKFSLKSQVKSDFSGYDPTQWSINPDTIMRVIWWLGIVTAILTLVIMIILCLYCIQFRKIKQRNSKKEACVDIGAMQCGSGGCECSRRLWDTGEPRRPNKPPPPVIEGDTSDFCESDQELGLRFTVQSSCCDDSSYTTPKKKSTEQRRLPRTN